MLLSELQEHYDYIYEDRKKGYYDQRDAIEKNGIDDYMILAMDAGDNNSSNLPSPLRYSKFESGKIIFLNKIIGFEK